MTDKESSITGSSRRNRALRKIRSSTLPQEIKATLQVLIDFLGHRSNYCLAWPCVATLAKRRVCGKSTIRFHLQAIKKMGIFNCKERLLPAAATAYVKEQYGFVINLSSCRGSAPVLYEVNFDHPLWDETKKLPVEIVQGMIAAVDEMKRRRNQKTTRGLVKGLADESPRGLVDEIQRFYVFNLATASVIHAKASGQLPFEFDNQTGFAAGNPDRVYAVATLETSSYCCDLRLAVDHLPTQPPQPSEAGEQWESQTVLSSQANSGLLQATPYCDKSQGSQGDSPGSQSLEPEERDYYVINENQSLEPEERDFSQAPNSGLEEAPNFGLEEAPKLDLDSGESRLREERRLRSQRRYHGEPRKTQPLFSAPAAAKAKGRAPVGSLATEQEFIPLDPEVGFRLSREIIST